LKPTKFGVGVLENKEHRHEKYTKKWCIKKRENRMKKVLGICVGCIITKTNILVL